MTGAASGATAERSQRRSLAPARRVAAALARRPLLVAALLYAVLSLVMVAHGLVPGWTLSGSDMLYSDVPWLESRPWATLPDRLIQAWHQPTPEPPAATITT